MELTGWIDFVADQRGTWNRKARRRDDKIWGGLKKANNQNEGQRLGGGWMEVEALRRRAEAGWLTQVWEWDVAPVCCTGDLAGSWGGVGCAWCCGVIGYSSKVAGGCT